MRTFDFAYVLQFAHCRDLPHSIKDIEVYLKTLTYDKTPDYEYIRSIMLVSCLSCAVATKMATFFAESVAKRHNRQLVLRLGEHKSFVEKLGNGIDRVVDSIRRVRAS